LSVSCGAPVILKLTRPHRISGTSSIKEAGNFIQS
jgi:hypothetical protein